jgi:uncharacterized membrane protein YgcG
MVQSPIKPTALTIDQEQANKQLELLGYKLGDNVYMRFFVPDGDPRHGTPAAARKADKLNWEQVERYQNEGYGVYFVINGGGHTDKHVTEGRALFCEWDDCPIEEQILAWQELSLPEPSMQVSTRKSVHTYWRADLTKEQWLELQEDLLVYTQSDQKLKNPSRVLRLAGCWHIKPGCEPIRCDIIHESERVYTYEELRAAIPQRQEPERQTINYQPSITDDVPLYQFLTKDDRALIDQGASQGSRNSSGAKLARNLIGTAARLNHLGIRFSDDPRHLFHDYCYRCTPSLLTREAEAIWKSALKDNPTPSLTDEALENCAKAWLRNQEKSSGRSFNGGIGSSGENHRGNGGSNGSGGDGGDDKQPLVELSLRDRVLEILNRNQERSHRDEAFIKLAQTTGATTREIKELATSLESEVDLGESRSERKTEIENLLRIGKYQLELQDYLDPAVAQPLKRVAGWMGTTPAAMLTTLYPVIGSLLKVGTRLELIKATDFYALPVVYTGLVCESGGGKSPAQKTIINPLFRLQDEAEIEYKKRLDEYQQELSEWKKLKDTDEPAPEQPVPREYYTTDATSEAIALIQSNQPNEGFLGWFDELPALFKSQGQYKNGRGADGEKILSGRDGTGFKVNRASGKRLVVNQSAYSITGSLQPLILRQMMGDFTDANGQWARFLWTVMQVQPAPYPDDAIPFDVSGLLKGIYKRLRNLPPITYTLSSQAKALYRNWYNELDRLKMAESRQGLRAVYSKMKGDTGVLALLLHCFNGCVLEGSVPNPEVSEQTMVAAIKLAKYHIGQVKLIHLEGDVANGDIAAIHAKIIQLSERKGWLKAADVRDIDRQTKKQFSADDIRRHFQELETSGFGQTKGEGTRLMWSIYKDSPPTGGGTHPKQIQDSLEKLRTNSGQTQDIAESITNSGVQPLVEEILEKTQDNSGQTQDSHIEAESIENIDIQPSVKQTQDTQDTFEPTTQQVVNSVSQKQIKSDVLSFSVLSCPEFVSESCDSTTEGVSAQDKTQDNCPETVLSCPEFESDATHSTLDTLVEPPQKVEQDEEIASDLLPTGTEPSAASEKIEYPQGENQKVNELVATIIHQIETDSLDATEGWEFIQELTSWYNLSEHEERQMKNLLKQWNGQLVRKVYERLKNA